MSRYIEADKVLKELHLNHKDVIYIDKNDTAKRIEKIQGIDLADYVPKDFHDKTCEAMAKRHTEEIQRLMPKRGEWIISEVEFGNYKYQCKECGWYEYHAYNDVKPYNFCPNCGADMREERKDDEF